MDQEVRGVSCGTEKENIRYKMKSNRRENERK
jgi:hypothetical protein